MAVYTTFFLCTPAELAHGFSGWQPPLPKPVQRQFKNPYTGEVSIIETREPQWPGEEDQAVESEYRVVAIQGNYEDYLEGRLPPAVRTCPHWAAKGLTEVELAPLAEILGFQSDFECPLYGPPSTAAVLQELPADMPAKLASLDRRALDAVAASWAATMSTPDYTHSATGVKLNDGWRTSEAMELLHPIVALTRQAVAGQRLYLLIEA